MGNGIAFDTNPCNVSSKDDIDASGNDGDPWKVFIHTTDVVASIRGLIGLMNASYLDDICCDMADGCSFTYFSHF